jgi:hypothetical protein
MAEVNPLFFQLQPAQGFAGIGIPQSEKTQDPQPVEEPEAEEAAKVYRTLPRHPGANAIKLFTTVIYEYS